MKEYDYPDMHWCPCCGEPENLCNCDPEFYDEPELDLENCCYYCWRESSGVCGFCGLPLCHMHFELGAGFCHEEDRHTPAVIMDYAKEIYNDLPF